MVEITAALVKKLRERTGAGMMDCKKALTENNGEFELSIDWLRTKGLSAAAKKSGRVAAEGLVGLCVKDNKASIIELNSETDFVARNDKFQLLVQNICSIALDKNDLEQLKAANYLESNITVEQSIQEHIAIIGENMNLRRIDHVSISNGVIGSYVHNNVAPGLGKIGVLISLESEGDKEKLSILAKQLSMHIAAAKPDAITVAEIDQAAVEREKQIFFEQARASGKPDNIIEKMVEGRVRKYYEEVVLLEQQFVIDGKTKISDLLVQMEKELGTSIKVTKFVIYSLGEGIEQESKNFSDEVKSIANI